MQFLHNFFPHTNFFWIFSSPHDLWHKMHIIKKIKVVDKTKGQIMPSNITQPLKSRHGDGDGSSAPTSKSNLNWLFYNRGIKNKFCLRLLLWDWLRMYSLSTLRRCCIIYFFKISLFKEIFSKSILTSLGKCPSSSDQAKIIFIHATLWKAWKWLPGKYTNSIFPITNRMITIVSSAANMAPPIQCPRESKTVNSWNITVQISFE